MKKLLCAISLIALSACSSGDDDQLDPARLRVQAHFNSGAEPTVKDAAWTQKSFFKVGVFDNGTRRDGYAMYVCDVIREQGVKDPMVTVHVFDVVKLVNTNKLVKLGEAHCR